MAVEQQNSKGASARAVLQEERYLWMARAFVVMFVLAIICDLILLIALTNVTPVMRVQPFYLEPQNKDIQVISVDRPSPEVLKSDVLQESLVRQYLMARFGVSSDLAELEARWGIDGPVFWMSDQSIYEAFLKKEAVPIQSLAQQDNFVRDVKISNLNRGGASQILGANLWRARLKFIDKDRVSDKERASYWVADLAVIFRPLRQGITWQDRLKNPLGFTVVQFGLQKDTEKSEE